MDEARETFDRLKPTVPPEIVTSDGGGAAMVRDGDNEPTQAEDGHGFIFVHNSKHVRPHIILHEISRNTKEGRQLRRIARLAQKFEKDHAAAVRASGYNEARSAMVRLRMELQDIDQAARAIKPSTMEGVAVYAAILIARAGPSYDNRSWGRPDGLGVAIAKALVDMAKGSS
jgi:hypothetical protein